MIYSNLIEFQAAVKNAKAGDELTLAPGTYDGNLDLDYRKPGRITVIMHGVTINGDPDNKREQYGVGAMGENMTILCDGININGGNAGCWGVLGHNIKIVSDLKGKITGHNRGMLLMGTNHHIQGLNFDGLGNIGIGGKGFPVNDNMNRTYNQNFGWYPANNWRITQCVFQNIQPIESGDAGGGCRIIPHAKNVMVDNCVFRNIKGSGLWGDHNQKGFEWYYNTFEDIDTAEAFGKAVFLEIMDPDPKDKSGFVAKIAGNTFRRCDTQTILIACSSGQNPAGIDVFGNVIEHGWGLVAGAMPRQFKRKWKFRDQSTHEPVDAKLENIRFRKNVIRNTTGRNHISLFGGKGSGLIEIDSNYYVTGHEYNFIRDNGTIETEKVTSPQIYTSGPNDNSLFIHGESNSANRDKNPLAGPMPTEFPFPEVFEEIPVARIPLDLSGLPVSDDENPVVITDPVNDDNPVINDPSNDDDAPKDDPVITPPIVTGKKRCVITTDLSDGDSDWDDWEALSLAVMYQDYASIEKVIIASKKIPTTGALEAFDRVFRPAYLKAAPKLNQAYGDYFKLELDVMEASSNGEGFTGNAVDLDKYPSTKAIIDLISDQDVLDVHWWGTGSECANVALWLETNAPEKMAHVRFISHAASSPTHNNYRKDKLASEYIEYIGETYGNYISMGFSGKTIDGKHSHPLVKIDGHGTALGDLTKYKHTQIKSGPKTDASDSITFIASYVNKFGGGEEYLKTLDWSGKSNEAKIRTDFKDLRPQMFPDLSNRFKEISDLQKVNDGPIVDDPIVTDPVETDSDKLLKAKGIIQNAINKMSAVVVEMKEDLDKLI